MSQVKLLLRPPPNVDFVTGYPGISPGPGRPVASVQGAIELRVPAQGVKAKWVRIELRKVETLPGGGAANSFYDTVGPGPVNLWSSAGEEYSLLRSQDFPFTIRIPESIPPSMTLEDRGDVELASITYELLASVCVKEKKGFLRKSKPVFTSFLSLIIIDKHELHSTWPVYNQPEKRQVLQDNISLAVDRKQTCFGPGDRISVSATLKSDNLTPLLLRGYEIYLSETTAFKVGNPGGGKKPPQTKHMVIAESKVALNSTIYGGTSNTAEVSCMVPSNHTTTTLNTARYIDVTYVLCVTALVGPAIQVSLELPVIISNWQRHVSTEAINRIGPTPNLSLIPATPNGPVVNRIISPPSSTTQPAGPGPTTTNTATLSSTLPVSSSTTKLVGGEAGYGVTKTKSVDDFGATSSTRANLASNTSTTAVSSSRQFVSSPGGTNRLTVKNADIRETSKSGQAQATSSSSSGTPQKQWPSAEEEKKLYEQARIKVAQVQGVSAAPPPASMRASSPPQSVSSISRSVSASASAAQPAQEGWLSAEEEKRRFQQAQAAVQRSQMQSANVSTLSNQTRKDPDAKPYGSSSSSSKPTGAALYAQAMSAHHSPASATAGSSSSSKPTNVAPPTKGAPYMTAAQEKTALRMYEEAKRAVDRVQNSADDIGPPPPSGSGPIAYESLFPAASRNAPAASSSFPPVDAPPPFDSSPGAPGGSNIMAHLSEKERLRRHHEAQDAAALAQQQQNSQPPRPAVVAPAPYTAPSPSGGGSSLSGAYANALEEKDAMRKKMEARDNARTAKANNPPPRSNTLPIGGGPMVNEVPNRSPSANASSLRPTPVPPASSSSSSPRILTAAEEKALLKAKMEAFDAGRRPTATTNGTAAPKPNPNAMSTPPLMPRPPVEYIKETQEEDARLSRINGQLFTSLHNGTSKANGSSGGAALDMKPFTPFRNGFDDSLGSPGPPPPLP